MAAEYLNRFARCGTLAQVTRGIAKRVGAEVGEMGEVVEPVALTDVANAVVAFQQVMQDALAPFVDDPFIDGYSVEVLEQPAESGNGVAAKVSKFFGGAHFGIVLHDEVLETFGVCADGVEEGADDVTRVEVGHQVNQLFAFQVGIGAAGGAWFFEVAFQVLDEVVQLLVEWKR